MPEQTSAHAAASGCSRLPRDRGRTRRLTENLVPSRIFCGGPVLLHGVTQRAEFGQDRAGMAVTHLRNKRQGRHLGDDTRCPAGSPPLFSRGTPPKRLSGNEPGNDPHRHGNVHTRLNERALPPAIARQRTYPAQFSYTCRNPKDNAE